MKKLVSLLMALTMVAVMMVGCGSSAGTASGEATYKIGATGPISGDAALYGIAVKNGMEIAINEINEAGGVNGAKFELNFQDDECDAEKAVNGYNTLKDWGMQVFIGTVTSGACIAVASNTYEDNMFQITPSGSDPKCIENPNAFQVCFADPSQGKKSAEYIGNKKLAEKVAVIYDQVFMQVLLLKLQIRGSILWQLKLLPQIPSLISLFSFRRLMTKAQSLYSFPFIIQRHL